MGCREKAFVDIARVFPDRAARIFRLRRRQVDLSLLCDEVFRLCIFCSLATSSKAWELSSGSIPFQVGQGAA